MRRSISEAHASSTPSSGSPRSRLSRRRAASAARSSSESTNAWAKRSSITVDICLFYLSRGEEIHHRRGHVRAPRPPVEDERRRHEAGVGAVALLGPDGGALGIGL